jgi:hypothetical protein
MCGLGYHDLGNTREQCLVGSTKLSFKYKLPDKLDWSIFISNHHTRKNVMHTLTAMRFCGYALVPFVCFALRALPGNGINLALESPRSPKVSGWLPTDENHTRQWFKVWIQTWSKVYPTPHRHFCLPTVNGQTGYQVSLFFYFLSG